MGSRGRLFLDLNEPPAEEEDEEVVCIQPQKSLPASNSSNPSLCIPSEGSPRILNNHAFTHASSGSGFQPFVRSKDTQLSKECVVQKVEEPNFTCVSSSSVKYTEDNKPPELVPSVAPAGQTVEREEGEWSDMEGSMDAVGGGAISKQEEIGNSKPVQRQGTVEGNESSGLDVPVETKTHDSGLHGNLKDDSSGAAKEISWHVSVGPEGSKRSDCNSKGDVPADALEEPSFAAKPKDVKGFEANHALRVANNLGKRPKLDEHKEAMLAPLPPTGLPPAAPLAVPRLPGQVSLLGARLPVPAPALSRPLTSQEGPTSQVASKRIGQVIRELFSAGSNFNQPGVLNEMCHGASLLASRTKSPLTQQEVASRVMRYSMEMGAMGFQLLEGAKKHAVELEGLSKKLAILESQRQETESRVLQAEARAAQAEGLRKEVALQVSDLRKELSETQGVLEWTESQVNTHRSQLEASRVELEMCRAAGRREEERLQAELRSLQQDSASFEGQIREMESAHLQELDLAKAKAVEDFQVSEEFSVLKVTLNLEAYEEGYDLGKSRGFAAGFKRAVYLAREKVEAEIPLTDLTQGNEAYASDLDVPRTPQVQLSSTPLPVDDEVDPEVAGLTEPSTEAPGVAATPAEASHAEASADAASTAPEAPADAAPEAAPAEVSSSSAPEAPPS